MNAGKRTALSNAGALTSAGVVAATIFCCLPFATGIVGASAAALGARFAAWQPYLATVSLGLLGFAFYQAYRRDAARCSGDRCDAPESRRYRIAAVWLVALAVVLLLTASWWANWVIYWTL